MSLLPIKMNKVSEVCEVTTVASIEEPVSTGGRVHDYVLNNKRTKTKLLKGAKRTNNLDIERKSGVVNMLFDDGSYFEVVLPLLRLWHKNKDETFVINGREIKVVESDEGIENSGQQVDTKLVLLANNDRFVVHAYNSTQKLMVQGKNYEQFAINCLEPYFRTKILASKDKIAQINTEVKEVLGGKNVIKIPGKKFNCPQCGVTTTTNGNLKVHMKTCHTKPSICSPTKNKIQKILNEDISIQDDSVLMAIEMEDQVGEQGNEQITIEESVETEPANNIDEEKPGLADDKVTNIVQKPIETSESPYICGECGEGFKSISLCTDHMQTHTFQCYKCDYQSEEKTAVLKHEESVHDNYSCNNDHQGECNEINTVNKYEISQIKCSLCDLTFESQEELEKHLSCHTVSQDLSTKIQCDQCEFCTEQVATFIRHIRTKHTVEKCRYCPFTSNTKEELEIHLVNTHEDVVLLHSMAQQVEEVKEMFEKFEHFKVELGDVIKCIASAVKGIENTQNEVKQELFVIRNNQTQPSSFSSNKSSEESKACAESPSSTNRNQTRSYAAVTKTTSNSRVPVPSHSLNEHSYDSKTLFIGDSISSNVDINSLEEATGSSITSARAYSSLNDTEANEAKQAVRFPNKNFQDVTPAELEKDDYNTLILQGGSVDITNLNTKANQSQNMEYFRQEAVISAKNLFQTAVNALSGFSTLEKVVVMKQTPRYDPINVDPLSLKPALAELYNNTLTQEWMDCDIKDKIYIGNHNIDCNGAIREARYRETRTGRFDGIHLYGSSGRKAYTKSVLNILKDAQVTTEEYNYHQDCPQYRYQHRQDRHTNYRTHNTVQQFTLPVYNRNLSNKMPVFSLPTENRFAALSRKSQGNW